MAIFRDYASDGPISWPINGEIRLDAELGGFGWNNEEGLFIPTDGEYFRFEPPYSEQGISAELEGRA